VLIVYRSSEDKVPTQRTIHWWDLCYNPIEYL